MTTGRHSLVFQQLRQAVLAHDGAGLTDAELMSHFVGQRDGAALEALIRRHGSMVWSVCRRVLSNEQDAEDAFQASFLVFVRKAASIRGREQVGNWLYGVAYRTAMKARTTNSRRRAKERRAAVMTPTQTETEESWTELLPVLDQELARLPDKYRTAIVLCELEGRSRKEAARQLGIPEGTLSSRLATGRKMLAKRFGRPGLALSAEALAVSATVPPTLLASTVKAVSLVAAGQATVAGVVSVRVAALAEGVIKAMLLTRISASMVLLAVIGVLAAGTGTAVYCAPAGRPDPKPPTPPVTDLQDKESNNAKGDVKKEEPEWGKAVDGVQVRVRMNKPSADGLSSRDFAVDVRNQGKRDVSQCRAPNFCEIEWDGKWYKFAETELECKYFTLQPGKQIDDWVTTSLDAPWKGLPEHKEPGKHTLRVRFIFSEGARPVSRRVKVVIGKESAWGEAVEGVQARIRTPNVVWKKGENPTFHLDLSNQGNTTPNARRSPYDCQIEVDKVWYSFDEPSGPYPTVGNLLKPGEQVNDWTIVSPDKNWGSFPGKAKHFPLPPGKHTVRIAYTLNGEKSIRPVSGPIEIEVSGKPKGDNKEVKKEEPEWGEAVAGVQARVRPAGPLWDVVQRPEGALPQYALDMRNQGKQTHKAYRDSQHCEIEIDGKWYVNGEPEALQKKTRRSLEPGKQEDNWVVVSLADGTPWVRKTTGRKRGDPVGDKEAVLQVSPGKHTLRIAFVFEDGLRPISQPLQIEKGEESAWGEAVDGVQARLRPAEARWDAGAAGVRSGHTEPGRKETVSMSRTELLYDRVGRQVVSVGRFRRTGLQNDRLGTRQADRRLGKGIA